MIFRAGASELGIYATFNTHAILFWIVGMGFGCSFSLVDVDCIDWVKTDWKKKLARSLLGVLLLVGLFKGITFWDYGNDEITIFFFKAAVPMFVCSFVLYGPYLVVC